MGSTPLDFSSNASFATGERRLMLATLEDGIRTILAGRRGRVARRKLQEDLDWLMSDDARHPFSFLTLCDALGIDPDYLRSRVLAAFGTTDANRAPLPHSVLAQRGIPGRRPLTLRLAIENRGG
jgi:hypothetical protein